MNILLCDDGQVSIAGDEMHNLNRNLAELLKQAGHNPTVFNGRTRRGQEIRDMHRLAARIEELICENEISGLVLDLDWFGSGPPGGIQILADLKAANALPVDMLVVIYSRFLDGAAESSLSRLGIPRLRTYNRNLTNNQVIADLFGKAN